MKKHHRRLVLRRESIRILTAAERSAIIGGMLPTSATTCETFTCEDADCTKSVLCP